MVVKIPKHRKNGWYDFLAWVSKRKAVREEPLKNEVTYDSGEAKKGSYNSTIIDADLESLGRHKEKYTNGLLMSDKWQESSNPERRKP
jgi:hypothetical protein